MTNKQIALFVLGVVIALGLGYYFGYQGGYGKGGTDMHMMMEGAGGAGGGHDHNMMMGAGANTSVESAIEQMDAIPM